MASTDRDLAEEHAAGMSEGHADREMTEYLAGREGVSIPEMVGRIRRGRRIMQGKTLFQQLGG